VIGMLDADATTTGVTPNLGYYIFVPYWRQGYAFEACSAVMQHKDKPCVKPLKRAAWIV